MQSEQNMRKNIDSRFCILQYYLQRTNNQSNLDYQISSRSYWLEFFWFKNAAFCFCHSNIRLQGFGSKDSTLSDSCAYKQENLDCSLEDFLLELATNKLRLIDIVKFN